VWFDRDLPAHRAYSDVISTELESASAVLVLWSKASVESQWVRSEANRARELGKLVQARLDNARLPMPFDQIQCADLTGWRRATTNAGWTQVSRSIDSFLGNEPAVVSLSEPSPSRRSILVGGSAAALAAATARGALTIGIANSPGGSLLAACGHRILAETGPEAIAGSTRMKAGTAQKVVLNLFSTLLMVQLGRVHRGLMVDMLARNDKLRRRAERMLAHLTGAPPEAIRAALGEAGGSVKRAVLVLQGLSAADAQALLDANANNLRLALAQLHATRETRP